MQLSADISYDTKLRTTAKEAEKTTASCAWKWTKVSLVIQKPAEVAALSVLVAEAIDGFQKIFSALKNSLRQITSRERVCSEHFSLKSIISIISSPADIFGFYSPPDTKTISAMVKVSSPTGNTFIWILSRDRKDKHTCDCCSLSEQSSLLANARWDPERRGRRRREETVGQKAARDGGESTMSTNTRK